MNNWIKLLAQVLEDCPARMDSKATKEIADSLECPAPMDSTEDLDHQEQSVKEVSLAKREISDFQV